MLRMMIAAVALCATVAPAMAADPAAGEKDFTVGKACHRLGEDAKNNVGPQLNGVVGRKAGSLADFNYSEPLKSSGLTWDEATLTDYLKNPKAKVPGTKMAYAGLKDETKIADIIAYLKQFAADGKRTQ